MGCVTGSAAMSASGPNGDIGLFCTPEKGIPKAILKLRSAAIWYASRQRSVCCSVGPRHYLLRKALEIASTRVVWPPPSLTHLTVPLSFLTPVAAFN